MKKFKPLAAATLDMNKLTFPLLATPKLDGIRCLMIDGEAVSKKLKPIPNDFTREQLKGLHGLDGELMVNGCFNKVQSAFMSKGGEPDFTYCVFDSFEHPERGYDLRIQALKSLSIPRVRVILPELICDEEKLLEFHDECLDWGFEGSMFRRVAGIYKYGRSTVKEGILLKFKTFHDDEAVLVAFDEKMHNTNKLETDELGYAKRRNTKDAKEHTGLAGAALLSWNGIEFKVGFGPGINDKMKREYWRNKHDYVGKIFKFTYQELSKDGVPRFGKLLGLRHPDDI